MKESFEDFFTRKSAERKAAGNLRSLPSFSEGIDFLSNDYLGWATTGALHRTAVDLFGNSSATFAGSTGSRLLSGNSVEAVELEQHIARIHEAEAALLFNSGYTANVGLLQALGDRHTYFFADELSHASILDGLRLAVSKGVYKFDHNDVAALREKLVRVEGKKIVVVESVYSMDGDEAPLHAIAEVCRAQDARLIIDEAHALGVRGNRYLGLSQDDALKDVLLARVYTYGKAMGAHGAAVVGSVLLRDHLVNFSRPFIYTTAAPLHQLQSIAAAYFLLQNDEASLSLLQQRISFFNQRKQAEGLDGFIASRSAIQCCVVGGNVATTNYAALLNEKGIRTKAILHPTVAEGQERLRFCLHGTHTEDELNLLIELLKQCNTHASPL